MLEGSEITKQMGCAQVAAKGTRTPWLELRTKFPFEELRYWDLTFRLTKGPSNEMQKSTCITSRRQMMKALLTTEAKARPKLGQG